MNPDFDLDARTVGIVLLSLLGVLLLTGVIATVLTTVLTVLGVARAVASPAGIAAGITAALAAADAFTPIGRGTRTDALERKGEVRLAAEVGAATLVGGAGGALLALAGGGGLVSVFGGALVGYAAFMLQNRRAYAVG